MPDAPVRVLLVEDDEDDYLLTRELFAELPPGAYHLDREDGFTLHGRVTHVWVLHEKRKVFLVSHFARGVAGDFLGENFLAV